MEQLDKKNFSKWKYIIYFSLFLLSNTISSHFSIPLIILLLINIFGSSNSEIFYLILFLIPNIRILDCTGNIHIVNILMAISAIVYLCRQYRKIQKEIMIAFFVLLTLELFHIFLYPDFVNTIFSAINITVDYLVCLQMIRDEESNFSFNSGVNYLTIGSLMSAIVCLFSEPNVMKQLENVSYYRFSAYGNDPNYYSVYLLLSIAGLFWKIQKNGEVIKNMVLVFALSLLGFLTSSKMFVFTLIFIFIANIFILSLKGEKKSLKSFGEIALIILLVATTASSIVKELFNRFLERFYQNTYSGSLLNKLTSGRSDIQAVYIFNSFSNPLLLLFGAGIRYSTFYKMIVTHNTYLDLFVSYGLIGAILIIVFSLKAILPIFNGFLKLEEYLPLMSYAIALFALSCLSSDMFFYLLVLVVLPLKKTTNECL